MKTILVFLLIPFALSAEIDFEKDIAPIFETHCIDCHNDEKTKGKFNLSTREKMLSHKYAVKLGNIEESELLEVISGDEPDMPPKGEPLKKKEIDLLKKWITSGAQWPKERTLKYNPKKDFDWWSLQPINSPQVPTGTHPVDHFVNTKLSEQKLQPNRKATPEVLIRRLSYDLTGLPPTASEIKQFLTAYKNNSKKAWENKVDELMSRKSFGEKWGQHWLDLARYADTHGYDKDKMRLNAWPYRDYVIRSINDDKPYNKFIKEQIAGDVIYPGTEDGIIGLGFLAAGPWDFVGHNEVKETKLDGQITRHMDRDEMVAATFNVFMSSTVQCAQCHHHKFDPIHQEDYYRLHAVFAAVDRADQAYVDLEPKLKKEKTALQTEFNKLNLQKRTLRRKIGKLRKAKKDVKGLVQQVTEIDTKLKPLQKKLSLMPKAKMVYAASTEFNKQGNFKATNGTPRAIHLLHRGDMKSKGKRMQPGAPPFWKSTPAIFTHESKWREGDMRKKLAEYLVAQENPLVWRSIANRLWQWTFGSPLVKSPNDFGRMGQKPTHPELLDFLAAKLKNDQQHSLKAIVKLLFTSEAYQRASSDITANTTIDAGNNYLWKYNRRRLTAEEFRDSLLFVSNKLSDDKGGPAFQDFKVEKPQHSPHYLYEKHDPRDSKSHRRTIYRFVVRSQPQPMLTTLDCADPSLSVPQRDESTTALQALAQWNNKFTEAMSVYFGDNHRTSSIEQICMKVINRQPNSLEKEVLESELKNNGITAVARIIFNMSAFTYVD